MDEQFKRLLEICAEEFGVTVEDILKLLDALDKRNTNQ